MIKIESQEKFYWIDELTVYENAVLLLAYLRHNSTERKEMVEIVLNKRKSLIIETSILNN